MALYPTIPCEGGPDDLQELQKAKFPRDIYDDNLKTRNSYIITFVSVQSYIP